MEERMKQDVIYSLKKEMKQRGFSEQETDLVCGTYEKMLAYPVEWESTYIAPSEVFGKKLLEITENESPLKDCVFNALLGQICIFLPREDYTEADKYHKAVSYDTKATKIYEEQIVGTAMEDSKLISEIYLSLNTLCEWLADISAKESKLGEEIEYRIKAIKAEEKACEYDPTYSSEFLAKSYQEMGLLYKKYADSFLAYAEDYLFKALDIYIPLAEKNDYLKYDLEECKEAISEVKEAQGWTLTKE